MWKVAPARALATRWGALTARHRSVDPGNRVRHAGNDHERSMSADVGAVMSRYDWPAGLPVGSSAPVGVVMVSFNTVVLTAQVIYSLYRNVRRPAFHLVVVDNASGDGSAQMLQAAADAGLCEVMLNAEQRYHGPGLNQGIDYLAQRQATVTEAERVGYVWILDSDCVVTREDSLSNAVDLMGRTHAGLVGQWTFDEWHQGDMMGLHCLLIDPRLVWRAPIARFEEGGSPSEDLQRCAAQAGIRAADFPFTRDGYAVHLGRATLRSVAQTGDRDNRYFDWATEHQEPHFMGEPDAPQRYATFLREFTADVGPLTPANLVAACLKYRSSAGPADPDPNSRQHGVV